MQALPFQAHGTRSGVRAQMSGACVELISDEHGHIAEVWIDGARIAYVDNATVLAEPMQPLQLVITVNVQSLVTRHVTSAPAGGG